MSDSLTADLRIVRDLAQVVVQAADHDDGETPARRECRSPSRARSRARCRSAMAIACGTVKLTVAVVVMPSATQSSSTSRPAAVAGSLTAMFGAQAWKRFAIGRHAGAIAGASGLTCAHTQPGRPAAGLVNRQQTFGCVRRRPPRQRLGLLFRRSGLRLRAFDGCRPRAHGCSSQRRHEHRVRGHSNGATLQTAVQLDRISRVMPPSVSVCSMTHFRYVLSTAARERARYRNLTAKVNSSTVPPCSNSLNRREFTRTLLVGVGGAVLPGPGLGADAGS